MYLPFMKLNFIFVTKKVPRNFEGLRVSKKLILENNLQFLTSIFVYFFSDYQRKVVKKTLVFLN